MEAAGRLRRRHGGHRGRQDGGRGQVDDQRRRAAGHLQHRAARRRPGAVQPRSDGGGAAQRARRRSNDPDARAGVAEGGQEVSWFPGLCLPSSLSISTLFPSVHYISVTLRLRNIEERNFEYHSQII